MNGRPDFFIVGAPRCGTTAMYEYLRRHPQIFMPRHKEPMYFGADLTQLHKRLTEADYLHLFKRARSGQRVGEASTWYLFSTSAAREIRDFAPEAQIIVMLRNPVDVMHSLHTELRFYTSEVIATFEDALAAEADRKQGRRLGPSRRPEALLYREVVRFADQLERYLEVFPPEHVKVVLFDDLVRDPAGTFADVLRFLGVDDTIRPAAFRVVNASKLPRLPVLQSLIVRPPRVVSWLVPAVRRIPSAHRLRAALLSANSRRVRRPPLDRALRLRLDSELAEEVRRLATVLDRDLSEWWSSSETMFGVSAIAAPQKADRV